jgi:[NiFe] hydrogenase diaphorase moiety large subunit
MDILLDVQAELGCVSDEAVAQISEQVGLSKVSVEETRSFYHFFTKNPAGKYQIYLNDSVVSKMFGMKEVAAALEAEAGCKFGHVTNDGLIGLNYTACIGMSDQEPAALINGTVFTKLTPAKAKELVAGFKTGKKVADMVTNFGDGNNNHELVKSMVNSNILKKGPVMFAEHAIGSGLKKAVEMTPDQIIGEVKTSGIRGRGGAGFPTGMKWDFCKREAESVKYIMCNADEGEPGTFKDRVILTERAEMVFEGMAVAGYTLGAKEGILYLRNEYKYLKAYLENVLADLRAKNVLGNNICGKSGFNFDIRIQFGAGAYVCGEESALIESCEGKRGEPRNRPPFPVSKGYKQKPTIINNVETFAHISKIMENGGAWYKAIGTKDSAGTKLLSISGDCARPGVYEIEWGMSIKEMLDMVGATNVQAVQVAGPSGLCINPSQFDKKIAYEDLPTGGSMIVLGQHRDIIKDVVLNFMEFFVDESCGSCVPCRALSQIMMNKVEKIAHGFGVKKDIDELLECGKVMKTANRCGLGQTAANPIVTTITNFREKYESLIKTQNDFASEFNMETAVKDSCKYVGRTPNIH